MVQSRRLRSKSVTLGLTLVAASVFTGCAAEQDGQAICVNPETEERVDDDSCDEDQEDYDGTGSGFFWFYMPAGTSAPAVGSRYNPSTGYYSAPKGQNYTKGGVPKSGGSISKGGFGSSGGKGSS